MVISRPLYVSNKLAMSLVSLSFKQRDKLFKFCDKLYFFHQNELSDDSIVDDNPVENTKK